MEDRSQFKPSPDAGMVRRVKQPLFEREIIAPGLEMHEALAKSFFGDEDAVNKAVRYLSHMQMFNRHGTMDRQINAFLMKINANKAIEARFVKLGVQAHGGLFWDSDASKEDKKYLTKLQERNRRGDHDGDERE